jgi:2'-5' RNA ligase superfamily
MKTSSEVIAIDVLLLPDDLLLRRAKETNTLLRQNYPAGYALDSEHTAHVTLVQRYIQSSDLEKVSAAVSAAVAADHAWKSEFNVPGYYSSPGGGEGLEVVLLIVEPTPELRSFQQAVADVVQPFAVSGGTSDAFVPNTDGTPIDQSIIKHVEKFVPASSGEHYFPHVTVGVAETDFVHKLLAEPFAAFSFTPAGVAMFQLGGLGTARKQLR